MEKCNLIAIDLNKAEKKALYLDDAKMYGSYIEKMLKEECYGRLNWKKINKNEYEKELSDFFIELWRSHDGEDIISFIKKLSKRIKPEIAKSVEKYEGVQATATSFEQGRMDYNKIQSEWDKLGCKNVAPTPYQWELKDY